jgi:hypothetical protein
MLCWLLNEVVDEFVAVYSGRPTPGCRVLGDASLLALYFRMMPVLDRSLSFPVNIRTLLHMFRPSRRTTSAQVGYLSCFLKKHNGGFNHVIEYSLAQLKP